MDGSMVYATQPFYSPTFGTFRADLAPFDHVPLNGLNRSHQDECVTRGSNGRTRGL